MALRHQFLNMVQGKITGERL